MARPARIEYEGAFYHIMNRGNRKEDIFLDDRDRFKFLEILKEIQNRYRINIYAFVLLPNHYHILLETPLANLSRAIQSLNGNYALYFSKKHDKPGHIFQGRFKAMLVEKDAYILELSRYIHLNPYRAGLSRMPERYKWSSLPVYLNKKVNLPFQLHWKWILSMFGKRKISASRKYHEFILEGLKEKKNPAKKAAGGWILGSDQWVEKVVEKWGDFSSSELSGVKPIINRVSVDELEKFVSKIYQVEKSFLMNKSYGNQARMAIIYLSTKYAGLTLKQAGQRYGGVGYSAAGKAAGRFQGQLKKDRDLKRKIELIMSNVMM